MMMGNPEIDSRTDDLFASIVEVVSKRPDLRLEFENTQKTFFMNNQDIPILGGAKEAREHHLRFTDVHRVGRQATVHHHSTDQLDEAVHVFPAQNRVSPRALAGIDDPAVTRMPEHMYGLPCEFIEC